MTLDVKDFLKNFADVVKNLIVRYEKDYKNLKGSERKERLDEDIENYVMTVVDNIKINFLLKFTLKKLLIKNIPTITQIIYNLIKTKVIGITE